MIRFFYLIISLIFIQGLLAQTPAELKSFLPVLPEWKISEEMEVFNTETLFNRINGSAPLFIENRCEEMTSFEYTQGDKYITVQAYRHTHPQDAFGMYASERSATLDFLPIGGEAQGFDGGLYFFAGNIYVKMNSSETTKEMGKAMKEIAAGFAARIDPQADYPSIIQAFPVDGKLPHSEAYVTSDYLGHKFLHSAYTANYNQSGVKFQAFVIDAQTTEGAKNILNKYVAFTKQSLDFSEGKLLIKDKYNGDIHCIWKGQYIIGIFNESGTVFDTSSLLNELSGNL